MLPYLFGLRTYFLMWGVATVLGVALGLWLARRAGLPARRALIALALLAVAVFAGAKLLYLFELVAFPGHDLFPTLQTSVGGFLSHGFRSPGGIALLALALPLVCCLLKLPTLRFADAVIPAVGIVVFFLRLGCFANGCCSGSLTDGLLGVRFPPDSRTFQWQVAEGLLSELGPALPVHPVQLYYGALGLALFVAGISWQKKQMLPGRVWARFYLLYFAGNFVLEWVQHPLYPSNILLCALGLMTVLGLLMRAELPRTRAPSHSS
jgi:phosphatidylglycerol:prolipoprotein diacylglycerol transferase